MKITAFRSLGPLLLAAAALAGAGEATAAQWKVVRTTPEKTTYLDTGGLRRGAEVVQAWELEKFSADQTSKAWEGAYRTVKSLTGYDCARRTTEPLLRVYLDGEGAEVKRVQMQGLQFPAAVEADSLREKMFDLACEPKPAKPAVAVKPTEKPEAKPQGGLMSEAAAADLPALGKPTLKKESPHPEEQAGAKPRLEKVTVEKIKSDDAKLATKPGIEKVAMLARPDARPVAEVPPVATAAAPVRREPRRAPRARPVAQKPASKPAGEAHWSYAGEAGADHWGSLRQDFSACAEGRQQSPIDIRDGARLDLEAVEFHYTPTPLRVVDTGHTVQVNVDAGRHITVMGRRYDLKQFHFHKPAEERIDGRSYDMVAHLVHKDLNGRIAVVAVLFEAGAENAFLSRLWPYLPLERGPENFLPDVKLELDRLLPESRTYYTYMGSLTTPPCTEGVLWIVMKNPVPVSPEQVAVFSRLYPMNARPIQAANGRFIKESN